MPRRRSGIPTSITRALPRAYVDSPYQTAWVTCAECKKMWRFGCGECAEHWRGFHAADSDGHTVELAYQWSDSESL